MKDKKVVLKLEDPKLFTTLYRRLRSFGVDVSYDSGSLVVSDSGEGDIPISRTADPSETAVSIFLRLLNKERFDELLIGIDTNQDRLTLAVVADGQLLESEELELEETPGYITRVIERYPHRRVYIGVGVGNGGGRKAYEYLKKFFPHAKKVNESKTNYRTPYVSIKDKDLRAAYVIAIRSTT
ncbi:hypothetical protein HA72_2038 [Metallosphaera sedula]|uniref:YqgF/RNase H-like domain-containing protein n=3 Tax=Metallosphaera TaxID=41980 RepID=A4YIC6_METS5|nr:MULTISPECIES: hypothetical protein [Metallosphaera]ABP96178.1 hypothetical protein Msed_2038 [Metallosphaera sedula DSM 5348]AIM28161.1 hypothetical protein HA72_2038 [Metallosphaera sedula]AKV74981.1 hypothetical protein MsedA_2088 [Metallosphaera sedula]AKV77219.1 hypothetical protein MsedB_2090 [Metallosphaera sedula]AKV79469.1 hypothetical protein MsedC_2088 [Metallosphaera sedula]